MNFLLCSTTSSFSITHLSLEVRVFRLIKAYIKSVNWYSFIALVSSHQKRLIYRALVSFHQGLKHEIFYTFIPLVSSLLLLIKSCHHYQLLPTPQISPHKRINILLIFASFISPMLHHGIARNLLLTFCSVLRANISYFCCVKHYYFPTHITKNQNHLDYVILVTFACSRPSWADPCGGKRSNRPKVISPEVMSPKTRGALMCNISFFKPSL